MLAAALLLPVLSARAAEDTASHRAPAPTTVEQGSMESEIQSTLAELWQRRIIPPEAARWSPDDAALLARIRRAETAGAVRYVKKRGLPGKDLIVVYRPVGLRVSVERLTKEGFERYLFSRSQDALEYFDEKDVGAKTAFLLTDLQGRRLFEKTGVLTEAGETLWYEILAGRDARWKLPSGEVMGVKRHPPAAAKDEPAPASKPAAKKQAPAPKKEAPGAPPVQAKPVRTQAPAPDPGAKKP